MTPRPVTATRWGMSSGDRRLISLAAVILGTQLGAQKFRDTVDYIPDRTQILSGFVRNIDIKFALHRKKDIDAIQRIDTEFQEGAVGGDLLLRKMLGCGNNGSDSRRQFFVGHKISVTFSKWKPCSISFGKNSRTAWSVTPM